jgi:hypothetical protein
MSTKSNVFHLGARAFSMAVAICSTCLEVGRLAASYSTHTSPSLKKGGGTLSVLGMRRVRPTVSMPHGFVG